MTVTPAQTALLARLRELVDETPTSGALTAAGNPLHVTALARAVTARADDGDALVAYVRAKVHDRPTRGCEALVRAGRPDLTIAALVADADAAWAPEFTKADREAAKTRLETMVEAQQGADDAEEAVGVTHDRKIVAQVSENRVAKGLAALTPEQEETMLARRAAARADGR